MFPLSATVFHCATCDFSSVTKLALTSHTRKLHLAAEAGQQFQCKYCDFTARWEGALSAHVNKKHGKESSENVNESKAKTGLKGRAKKTRSGKKDNKRKKPVILKRTTEEKEKEEKETEKEEEIMKECAAPPAAKIAKKVR